MSLHRSIFCMCVFHVPAELKMEVLRERELRETLEKQLQEEQKNRILMQKRCAKLKKLRRRLQERLDVEVKRRSRYEDHIRSNSPDALGDINGERHLDNKFMFDSQLFEKLRTEDTLHKICSMAPHGMPGPGREGMLPAVFRASPINMT